MSLFLSILIQFPIGILCSIIGALILEHLRKEDGTTNNSQNDYTGFERSHSQLQNLNDYSKEYPTNTKFQLLVHRVIVGTFSYLSTFLAFYLPARFQFEGQPPTLYLLNSKLPLDTIINNNSLVLISIMFSLILYIPIWQLSKAIFELTIPTFRRFTFINKVKYYSYTTLIMILILFLIAGNIEWLLREDNVRWLSIISKYFLYWMGLNFLSLVLPSNR